SAGLWSSRGCPPRTRPASDWRSRPSSPTSCLGPAEVPHLLVERLFPDQGLGVPAPRLVAQRLEPARPVPAPLADRPLAGRAERAPDVLHDRPVPQVPERLGLPEVP